MTNTAKSILNQALELSPLERSNLVELILSSLNEKDTNIDTIWAKESDARVEAYSRGDIKAVSVEEVFSKHQK